MYIRFETPKWKLLMAHAVSLVIIFNGANGESAVNENSILKQYV